MKIIDSLFSILSKERGIRTVWRVEKDGRSGFLAATAHFFPYSLKKSLRNYIQGVQTVCFEGPLDEKSRQEVVERGSSGAEGATALYEALEVETIKKIKEATGDLFREKERFAVIFALPSQWRDPLYHHFQTLRPWMAFFRIWAKFLERRGWKFSVDLQALQVATELRKEIVYLETIEEQIDGLEGIPLERFILFFRQIDQWEKWARISFRLYLQGDIDGMMAVTQNFPSRCPSIVENRDPVLFERMKNFFAAGAAIAFVGVPHIPGIRKRFQEEGYTVSQVREESP